MKQWKFQNNCDESDEIAKEKYVKIVGQNLKKKFDLEKSCRVTADWIPEATQFCLFMLYVGKFFIEKSWNLSEFGLWSAVLSANGTNTQKTRMDCNLIVIAKIFFIAMNSLFADKYIQEGSF